MSDSFIPPTLTGHSFAASLPTMMQNSSKPYILTYYLINSIQTLLINVILAQRNPISFYYLCYGSLQIKCCRYIYGISSIGIRICIILDSESKTSYASSGGQPVVFHFQISMDF